MLQQAGLQVVFTSELVRPEMRVLQEPASSEPREALEEILAAHGLTARPGPGGTLVVVRAEARPKASASPSLVGEVRSAETAAPLAGVAVRLLGEATEAKTDTAGRFVLEGLAAGSYRLEAELSGYLPLSGVEVAVSGAAAVQVELTLVPLPFFREEVVVRPSRLALLEVEGAGPLALSREQIESLPQLSGDLFRALSLLPGTYSTDVSAQIQVHGGRRDEVQVLLDGQELYEAYHLQEFDNALSVVASGNVAGASLSTGAYDASHGDRMSAVLDLTSQAPTGPRQVRLGLSLLDAEAAGQGSWRDHQGSWLASLRLGTADLARHFLRDQHLSFWDLFAKLNLPLTRRQSLRAEVLGTGDTVEIRAPDKLFHSDYDTRYFWASHEAGPGDRLLARTTASWTELDRDRRGREDEPDHSFDVADERGTEVLGLAEALTYAAPLGQTLEGGLEARRYRSRYDYSRQGEPSFVLRSDQVAAVPALARFEAARRGDHLGAYLSDRFNPWPRLTAELGLRYDRHTLTDDTLLSPRINLAGRLDAQSVLRAAWGQFYQSQRPYELAVEDGQTHSFRAERSEHWVLGYERQLERAGSPLKALRLEAYRRGIDDPRPRGENVFQVGNPFSEAEPDRVLVAPEESRAQGLELTLEGKLGRRADWWLNYAYSRAWDRLGGRRVRRQSDQPHALNLFLHSRLESGWDLSLAWRYHTGLPTTAVALEQGLDEDGEPTYQPVLGRLYARRLPAYHRLDLRASRSWQLRSGRLSFFLDLQNLYHRLNVAGADVEVDAEEGLLRVKSERWPGFFPSVGIRWEL
ncbi:MAG: TonB-dependent receptor [Thermoanaerobaculia bacterium]